MRTALSVSNRGWNTFLATLFQETHLTAKDKISLIEYEGARANQEAFSLLTSRTVEKPYRNALLQVKLRFLPPDEGVRLLMLEKDNPELTALFTPDVIEQFNLNQLRSLATQYAQDEALSHALLQAVFKTTALKPSWKVTLWCDQCRFYKRFELLAELVSAEDFQLKLGLEEKIAINKASGGRLNLPLREEPIPPPIGAQPALMPTERLERSSSSSSLSSLPELSSRSTTPEPESPPLQEMPSTQSESLKPFFKVFQSSGRESRKSPRTALKERQQEAGPFGNHASSLSAKSNVAQDKENQPPHAVVF